jgi:hypothetical protein
MLSYAGLNAILYTTFEKAFFFIRAHDPWFKQYAFQSAAWEAYEELVKVTPEEVDEPLRKIVAYFLEQCKPHFEAMNGQPNISFEEHYPRVAAELIYMAQYLDHLAKQDPSILADIDKEKFCSAFMLTKIARLAESFIEKKEIAQT